MTPEQRSKLIRRLCLFGPLLSAASILLLAVTPMRGLLMKQAQTVAPALVSVFTIGPVVGWFVLTLGCSAVTALYLLKLRRESCGSATFVMLSVAVTVLVFVGHLIVTGTLAFAGCVIAFR